MNKLSPQQKVISTAISLFQENGYTATTMQNIVDKAKVSEEEVHFLYPDKKDLFIDVFLELYGRIAPQLEDILNGNMPVFEKIRHFTNNYVNFINNYNFLPVGLMRKLNPDAELTKAFIVNTKMPNPDNFYKQIEKEIEKGNIRPMNPKQILINIFALSVFPHVASPLLKDFINVDNEEFDVIKNSTKTMVADFIINAIKIEKEVFA